MSRHSDRSIIAALRRIARQPSFTIVVGILLVAAVSLNASVEFLQLHFQKRPVDLRQELARLPSKLGPWVQISKDEPLPVDEGHTLGTEKYIFRFYADSRLIKPAQLAQFDGKDFDQRRRMITQLQEEHPGAVINSAVTYYTGMVDTVAHIPDRCYIADGFVPSSYKLVSWSAFNDRPGRANGGKDARLIYFEDQSADRRAVPRSVAYFFHCNGQYESDPIDVRKRLGNLFEPFGYYAKVELMMQMHDNDAAGKVMDDFLHYALPEVEKCLPDWKSITARKS